jgi:putative ABC transport system substrate-binding protein
MKKIAEKAAAAVVVFSLLFPFGPPQLRTVYAETGAAAVDRVAVVVSRKIKPFVEAVDGFVTTLMMSGNREAEIFYLPEYERKGRALLKEMLTENTFRLLTAVGPEATRFIWQDLPETGTPKLYSIVVNPEALVGPEDAECGIPFSIPPGRQIETIRRALPGIHRLGLLYNPDHNESFFQDALAAETTSFSIVPLRIGSKRDIAPVLRRQLSDIDALWMIVDRTIDAESLVRFIIKTALLKKVPVIGYNRFFYRSGAAFSFVFQYDEIGRQTAGAALSALSGMPCRKRNPVFHGWINRRVYRRLSLALPADPAPPLEIGP